MIDQFYKVVTLKNLNTGEVYRTDNLFRFCRELNLNYPRIKQLTIGRTKKSGCWIAYHVEGSHDDQDKNNSS